MRRALLLAAALLVPAVPALAGPCDDLPAALLQAIQATAEGRKAWATRDPVSCELRRDPGAPRPWFRFWSTTEPSPTNCGFWWRYEADSRGGWRGPTPCS